MEDQHLMEKRCDQITDLTLRQLENEMDRPTRKRCQQRCPKCCNSGKVGHFKRNCRNLPMNDSRRKNQHDDNGVVPTLKNLFWKHIGKKPTKEGHPR